MLENLKRKILCHIVAVEDRLIVESIDYRRQHILVFLCFSSLLDMLALELKSDAFLALRFCLLGRMPREVVLFCPEFASA